jgi:hypothetical protein
MADAQLCEHGVDRPDLHAAASARVPNAGSGDVVLTIGLDQRQGGEALDDLRLGLRAGKALQNFLQHETGRDHKIVAFQGVLQGLQLRLSGSRVPAKGQGPDAGVDEQGHQRRRERSAL